MKTLNTIKIMGMMSAAVAMLVLLPAVSGCSGDYLQDVAGTAPEGTYGKMTVFASTGQDADTRVTYTDGAEGVGGTLAWQAGDHLTVVRMNDGSYVAHATDYQYEGVAGASSGTFTGTEITDEGDSWKVYYPNRVTVDGTDGSATLAMTGQKQVKDNSTEHLRDYILLASEGNESLDGVNMQMRSSIMKFIFSGVPAEVGELRALTWTVETEGTAGAEDGGLRSLTLEFPSESVNFGQETNTLTAYLAFIPEEMKVKAGGRFAVTLSGDEDYRAETVIEAGKTYSPGMRYTVAIDGTENTMKWNKYGDSMRFAVKVSSSASYSIKFNGTAPAKLIVNWGDGSEPTMVDKGTELTVSSIQHNYTSAGTYTITIWSEQEDASQQQIPSMSFSGDKSLVCIDTPLLNMGATSFDSCFYFCTSLTTIPAGLFDKNTEATTFSNCFFYCTSLTTIPVGLFTKNTKVTTFGSCFLNCSRLTTIPEGMFATNTAATRFVNCFKGCSRLVLNENIFSVDNDKQRFSGKNMDFTSCFQKVGSMLTSGGGTAPDLWNYEQGGATWSFTGCFNGATNLTNYSGILDGWK